MSKLQPIRIPGTTHPPLRQRHPVLAAALVCAMTLPAAMAVDAANVIFSPPWATTFPADRGGFDRLVISDPAMPTGQPFAILDTATGTLTARFSQVSVVRGIKVPISASAPYLAALGLTTPFPTSCAELMGEAGDRLVNALAARGLPNTGNSTTPTSKTWTFYANRQASALPLRMGLHHVATGQTRYAPVSAPSISFASESASMTCSYASEPQTLTINANTNVGGFATPDKPLIANVPLDQLVSGDYTVRLLGGGALSDFYVNGFFAQTSPAALTFTPPLPVANAGADVTVEEGALVQLDASQSSAPGGAVPVFSWRQIGLAPTQTPIELQDAQSATPSFTAPAVPAQGQVLTFEVTVTANGTSVTDEVNVLVRDLNHVPVAAPGPDQTVREGSDVTLDGSASFDIDEDALSYYWTQESGMPVEISDPTAAQITVTAPMLEGGDPALSEPLVFRLNVDDGLPGQRAVEGYDIDSHSATVLVTVTNNNQSPQVSAGSDQVVTAGDSVVLNAVASDPDGDAPLTYRWTQTAGPSLGLLDATSATLRFQAPSTFGSTTLSFMVQASDPFGSTGAALVNVVVQSAGVPPDVSAARASVSTIWPPDHRLVPVSIVGMSEDTQVRVTRVTQNEPVNGKGDGNTEVDHVIKANGEVLLRAERAGGGNGRVYTLHFTATNPQGDATGSVTVTVPKQRR